MFPSLCSFPWNDICKLFSLPIRREFGMFYRWCGIVSRIRLMHRESYENEQVMQMQVGHRTCGHVMHLFIIIFYTPVHIQ